MRRFKHIPCHGTGMIENSFFESCRGEKYEGDCSTCRIHFGVGRYTLCKLGKMIPCEVCQANGFLDLQESEWEEVDIKSEGKE